MDHRYKKGLAKELMHSSSKHRVGTPVLINPSFLRTLGAGQVDLVVIERDHIFKEDICVIYEIKSFAYLSWQQRDRLYGSCLIISELLDISCQFSVLYDEF